MTDPLHVLIVEDEGLIAEVIKDMVEEMGHRVVGIAHNLKQAQALHNAGRHNFAILDINLEGGMEGIQFAEQLSSQNIPFMFLTSYADRNTIEEAKRTVPGAYVLKPFTEEELYAGIEMARLHSSADKASAKMVSLKDGLRTLMVKVDELRYLKADNVYVELHMNERKLVMRQPLGAVLGMLPADRFIRVHRSYAVNKAFVTTVSRNSLQLGDTTIPISRSMRDEVLKNLKP